MRRLAVDRLMLLCRTILPVNPARWNAAAGVAAVFSYTGEIRSRLRLHNEPLLLPSNITIKLSRNLCRLQRVNDGALALTLFPPAVSMRNVYTMMNLAVVRLDNIEPRQSRENAKVCRFPGDPYSALPTIPE